MCLTLNVFEHVNHNAEMLERHADIIALTWFTETNHLKTVV